MEQFDELARLKREHKREERERRRSTRKMSKLMVPEAGLQALLEEAEEDKPIADDEETGDENEGEAKDCHPISTSPRVSRRPSSAKKKGSSRRHAHTKQTPPVPQKASSAVKSPRKVKFTRNGGSDNVQPQVQTAAMEKGGHEREENVDLADLDDSPRTPNSLTTRISIRSSRRSTSSPLSSATSDASNIGVFSPIPPAVSVMHRHSQTDMYETEYGNILDKNTWLQQELYDHKDTIKSMEEHMLGLNREIADWKMKLDDQVRESTSCVLRSITPVGIADIENR